MTSEERAIADQPEKGEDISETPEVKRHGLTNETAYVDREVDEVEMCPTARESELWDHRRPEPPHAEDHKYNSQATVSLLLHICATSSHDLC